MYRHRPRFLSKNRRGEGGLYIGFGDPEPQILSTNVMKWFTTVKENSKANLSNSFYCFYFFGSVPFLSMNRRQSKVAHSSCIGRFRRGAWGTRPPLIFWPNRAEKNFLGEPPHPPYFKVWIRHWVVLSLVRARLTGLAPATTNVCHVSYSTHHLHGNFVLLKYFLSCKILKEVFSSRTGCNHVGE